MQGYACRAVCDGIAHDAHEAGGVYGRGGVGGSGLAAFRAEHSVLHAAAVDHILVFAYGRLDQKMMVFKYHDLATKRAAFSINIPYCCGGEDDVTKTKK